MLRYVLHWLYVTASPANCTTPLFPITTQRPLTLTLLHFHSVFIFIFGFRFSQYHFDYTHFEKSQHVVQQKFAQPDYRHTHTTCICICRNNSSHCQAATRMNERKRFTSSVLAFNKMYTDHSFSPHPFPSYCFAHCFCCKCYYILN